MVAHPTVSFIPAKDEPGIEVLVNFGILTGRAATPAEIDRLAEWLLDMIATVTIVGEERHEIGSNAEASVHQVRIVVPPHAVPEQLAAQRELCQQILERADHWARACASLTHFRE